ncbi:helix-hairpin-helix domain-containing protein [Halorhabdus rudnickae]|uniref:helix-hairpin-helix domain-containing protein n=1 Tax=Halorhabdus rudnickae TaxID=1775544 RepID=UPI001082B150|nr:helix-hairpin-helix domain-containing protein [Halorhabdus rudnickae]
MGLIERIKVALGLAPREPTRARQEGGSTGQDVAVTVEHEPNTETEDAVKGTGTDVEGSAEGTAEPAAQPNESTEDDESATIGTGDDESATTATTDDESTSTATADTDERASVATDDDSEPTSTDDTETEAEDEDESEGTAESSEEAVDVQSIDGIGPAYAERLGEAGIEAVADLREADAATVAEDSGIAEGRVSTWIERASE